MRILVADDHEIVRKGLCQLVRSRGDWEVCGEARDGNEVCELAGALHPDLVILDLGMPGLNGLEATRRMVQANPAQKVLILTITDAEQMVEKALQAGARGFVLKSDAGRDLIAAIDAVSRGMTFFTARVDNLIYDGFCHGARSTPGQVRVGKLTAREQQIVQYIAEGKSTREIAALLNISAKTTETHRNNILRKLKIHSVPELVMFALRNNIVAATSDTHSN
jgi:DNA-binding NarL/FixJ family response regulator